MAKILVSGLVNIETTLKVESFPINYEPVRYPFYGVNSTVTGVGVNVAKAIKTLGGEVEMLSIIGRDFEGDSCMREFEQLGLDTSYVLRSIEKTPQSVIIYEESGRRMINVDLKDVQETAYPQEIFLSALEKCDIAVLCNINFSRPFLKIAKDMGKIIATDVHVLGDINDPYNSDFMKYSDILFLSNENCCGKEREVAKEIGDQYKNKIIVIGMGKEGALLYTRENDNMEVFPAVNTRTIINTIGAGDSLFTAFIYYYDKTKDAVTSLKKAIVFASWKIGEKGAAEGFLSENELEKLFAKVY